MSNHAIQQEELRNRNLSRLPNAGYDPDEARDYKGMWEKIDETARKYNGNTSWAKGVKKDNFPPNTHKCNKFVFDVLKELGIKVEIHGRPPLAAEWTDKNTKISGWRVLKSDETPQPGDVAAYKESGGGMGYSGHVGFIISDGKGGISNISAHDYNVAPKDGQFDPKKDAHKIVFRRYVGK